jgi:hypothetical protein|tara:strand:- start:2257 stop:2538 length:282 start_codon:yes stop_codon:yes gene_type:complete
MEKLKDIFAIIIFLILVSLMILWLYATTCSEAIAKSPKAKFYDFNEQLIDGEVKKPMTLYTDSRDRVKFERLLRLKKSFMGKLFDTSKEKVFK